MEQPQGATKFFDPYILIHSFGIFANDNPFDPRREGNWDSYIRG